MSEKVVVGQIVKLDMYSEEHGSFWRYAYVKNVYDGMFHVVDEVGLSSMCHEKDYNRGVQNSKENFSYTLLKRDGKPVMAKRITLLFGLIRVGYLPQPQY